MRTKERKTRDRWDIETNRGYGWEIACSEYTHEEAMQRLKEYRDNSAERFFVRIRRRREYICLEQARG